MRAPTLTVLSSAQNIIWYDTLEETAKMQNKKYLYKNMEQTFHKLPTKTETRMNKKTNDPCVLIKNEEWLHRVRCMPRRMDSIQKYRVYPSKRDGKCKPCLHDLYRVIHCGTFVNTFFILFVHKFSKNYLIIAIKNRTHLPVGPT